MGVNRSQRLGSVLGCLGLGIVSTAFAQEGPRLSVEATRPGPNVAATVGAENLGPVEPTPFSRHDKRPAVVPFRINDGIDFREPPPIPPPVPPKPVATVTKAADLAATPETDPAAARAATRERLKALPKDDAPEATAATKGLRTLFEERLALFEEREKAVKERLAAENPQTSPERLAEAWKADLARVSAALDATAKNPDALLPASFRDKAGVRDGCGPGRHERGDRRRAGRLQGVVGQARTSSDPNPRGSRGGRPTRFVPAGTVRAGGSTTSRRATARARGRPGRGQDA